MSTTQADETALEVRRSFKASPATIFKAWTDPAQLKNWMAPSADFKTEATTDPQVGGGYRFAMTDPTGKAFTAVGEYREVDAPNRLVFTWSWEQNDDANGSVVTIELTAVDGGCELLLRHELLASEASRDHHNQGWNGCLARLETLLAA